MGSSPISGSGSPQMRMRAGSRARNVTGTALARLEPAILGHENRWRWWVFRPSAQGAVSFWKRQRIVKGGTLSQAEMDGATVRARSRGSSCAAAQPPCPAHHSPPPLAGAGRALRRQKSFGMLLIHGLLA